MSPEPAASDSPKLPQAALIGGGALLVAGICLIVVAVLRSGGGSSDDLEVINLTSGAAPSTIPAVVAVPTEKATPAAGPTKKAIAAAKPAAATTQPAAPKAKPKPKPEKKAPVRIKAAPNTAYQLRNVVTGKCVGPMASTAELKQQNCTAANKVRLEPTRAVSGVQLYRLRDAGGADLCLDVPNFGSEQSGTVVSAYACLNPSSGDNQEWQLKDSGRTSTGHIVYTVVNFKSGNCLNVQNWAADKGDRAAGIALSIFTCTDPEWGYDDHLWAFS